MAGHGLGHGQTGIRAPSSFDLLVLGCGGGPTEDNLSAYLIKPKQQRWRHGFTSVDGGSCLGALHRLLRDEPEAFHDFDIPQPQEQQPPSLLANVGYVFGLLTSFLITHAHWDHISGLVLASGSGALQKSVFGSKQTLENLASAMNGGLWPILGSYEEVNGVPYVWRTITPGGTVKPSPGLTASMMPVSHGRHHKAMSYESTAFFIGNEYDGRSTLIFGDVEADSISGETFNRAIWQETSKRIAAGKLSTILIECSYDSSRPKEALYGHLSPVYIFEELRVLAGLLPPTQGQAEPDLRGRLRGVNIGIIHVKDPTSFDISPCGVISASPTQASSTSPHPRPPSLSLVPVEPLPTKASTDTSEPPLKKVKASSIPPRTKPSSESLEQQEQAREDEIDRPENFRRKILQELLALEEKEQLGCHFIMLEQGMRLVRQRRPMSLTMDLPSSPSHLTAMITHDAAEDGLEEQTIPRPIVKKTYGRPKPAPVAELHEHPSITSDLTSLSQLSARPSSQLNPDEKMESDDSDDSDDGAILPKRMTIEEELKWLDDEFDSGRVPSVAVKDLPTANLCSSEQPLDQSTTRRVDAETSSSSSFRRRPSSSPPVIHPRAPPKAARLSNNTLASSSTESSDVSNAHIQRHSSPPTSGPTDEGGQGPGPGPGQRQGQGQGSFRESEESMPIAQRRTNKTTRRPVIQDSDASDDEEDKRAAPSSPAKQDGVKGERSVPLFRPSDDDDEEQGDEPVQHQKTASRRSFAAFKAVIDSDDDTSEDGEKDVTKTQESEEIEDYQESLPLEESIRKKKERQSKSAGEESPDGQKERDIKNKHDGKRRTKPLSKAQLTEMHRESAVLQRSQNVCIEKKTKAPKSISELMARVKPPAGFPVGIPTRPVQPSSSSSNRPISLTGPATGPRQHARARSESVKPSLTTRNTHPPPTSARRVIDLNSSSTILGDNDDSDDHYSRFPSLQEQDSMDLTFLESLPRGESQSSYPTNKYKSGGKAMKSSTSPIIVESQLDEDDDDDDDEELPDIKEEIAKEQRKRALQEKKRALMLAASMRTKASSGADRKGKGRALSVGLQDGAGSKAAMDLSDSDVPSNAGFAAEQEGDEDDDDDDLEIVIKAATHPKIERSRSVNPTQAHLSKVLAPLIAAPGTRVKREAEDEVTESQMHLAGRTFGTGQRRTVVNPHVQTDTTRGTSKASHHDAPTTATKTSATAAPAASKKAKAPVHITQKAQNKLLLDKVRQQGAQSRQRRQEDWKRRGGSFMRDNSNVTNTLSLITDEEPSGLTQQLSVSDLDGNGDSVAKTLLQNMRAHATEISGGHDGDGQEGGDEDEDDEEDGDYVGSAEEDVDEEEEDAEMGSADEEELEIARMRRTEMADENDDEDEEEEEDRLAIAPEEGSSSPVRVEAKRRHATRPTTSRAVVQDEDEEMESQSQPVPTELVPTILEAGQDTLPSAPTQYHDFVVKGDGVNAFPQFDGGIEDISLTQVFGRPDAATQERIPQASRAVIGEGEGFSQFFADGAAESQFGDGSGALQPTPTQIAPASLPDMFKKNKHHGDSPALQRHAIGEAPIILDAALRDAEVREEAERAYYEIQQRKMQQGEVPMARHLLHSTTTPGSTLSEDLPSIPHVSDALDPNTPSRGLGGEDDVEEDQDENGAYGRRNQLPNAGQSTVNMDLPEEDEADDEDEGDDEGTTDSPSFARRGLKLRRAGEVVARSRNGSPGRPANAFDALRQGQQRLSRGDYEKAKELRRKAKKSEFLAGEASESEEEGLYAALRKGTEREEGEGADDDNSDLDKEVEDLVDNAEVDQEEREAQDELALQKRREMEEADDEKMQKRVKKIVEGQERKKRRSDDLIDGFDSSDDEAALLRLAKTKKQKQYDSRIEALADNEETQAFAAVVTRADEEDLPDTTYLQDTMMEAGSDEDDGEGVESDDGRGGDRYLDTDEEDDGEGVTLVATRSKGARPGEGLRRQRTPDYDTIKALIDSSSPVVGERVVVKDRISSFFQERAHPPGNGLGARTAQTTTTTMVGTTLTAKTLSAGNRANPDDFDDLEESYNSHTSTSLFERRSVILDKDEGSQNDRGVGPGKSSAVTNYVKKHARADGSALHHPTRQQNPRTTTSSSSTTTLTKSRGGNSFTRANSLASNASTGRGGRLALARKGSIAVKAK